LSRFVWPRVDSVDGIEVLAPCPLSSAFRRRFVTKRCHHVIKPSGRAANVISPSFGVFEHHFISVCAVFPIASCALILSAGPISKRSFFSQCAVFFLCPYRRTFWRRYPPLPFFSFLLRLLFEFYSLLPCCCLGLSRIWQLFCHARQPVHGPGGPSFSQSSRPCSSAALSLCRFRTPFSFLDVFNTAFLVTLKVGRLGNGLQVRLLPFYCASLFEIPSNFLP